LQDRPVADHPRHAGRPKRRFAAPPADKAYSSAAFRQARRECGTEYQVRDRRSWYAWLVVARTLTAKGEPAPAASR
jgi:hypothetical protein